MEKSVIYFEQFLAGLFLFKGREISHEEIADAINGYISVELFDLKEKPGALSNLVDFVEVTETGFQLKEDISLDAKIVNGYTIADHFIVNTGKPLYNFMYARFNQDDYQSDPYEKAVSKFKKRK